MKRCRQMVFLVLSVVWLATSLAGQLTPARLTILLSNDDGYEAPGLKALITALQPVADIIVAAPATEQSGMDMR